MTSRRIGSSRQSKSQHRNSPTEGEEESAEHKGNGREKLRTVEARMSTAWHRKKQDPHKEQQKQEGSGQGGESRWGSGHVPEERPQAQPPVGPL